MTTLSQDLLDLLVCPKCKGDLAVEAASLRCDNCRLRYRIDEGIPVMLIDEAQSLDAVPADGEADRPPTT